MIKERHLDHVIMRFDPVGESGVDHMQAMTAKMGAGYLSDLIHEANLIGLKGRRVTDIIVEVETKSKEIIVEYWTADMK